MIYFLSARKHDYTVRHYLQSYGSALSGQLMPLSYRQAFRASRLPVGTYIFADIERLSVRCRHLARHTWRNLDASGRCQLLNHPTRTRRRYRLLRNLYERGRNRFNVYRVSSRVTPRQFPVFLRGENDHKGSETPLLDSTDELTGRLRRRRWSLKGRRAGLITEFCDTRDASGIFRKYSAFIVGGRVIPRHLFFETNWLVKRCRLGHESLLEEEFEYVQANPHEQQLKEIFSAANVRFGRIDYGVLDGRVQVWEINTNPMIMTVDDRQNPWRVRVQEYFSRRFADALKELDRRLSARTSVGDVGIDISVCKPIPRARHPYEMLSDWLRM